MILQYINFNYSTIFTHSYNKLTNNILDMLHCEISTDLKKYLFKIYHSLDFVVQAMQESHAALYSVMYHSLRGRGEVSWEQTQYKIRRNRPLIFQFCKQYNKYQ